MEFRHAPSETVSARLRLGGGVNRAAQAKLIDIVVKRNHFQGFEYTGTAGP